MFTGLVETTARIVERSSNRLTVELCDALDGGMPRQGDSVCVNGVCLTTTKTEGQKIVFDVSHESLAVTNIAESNIGEKVNIERSMPASGRFHGHFVTGHVDAVGIISKVTKLRDYMDVVVKLDVTSNSIYGQMIVPKGSIAVNGVSLTVNEVFTDKSFRLTLVPHTLKMTELPSVRKGDRVNIEFDILAKYVHNMVNGRLENRSSKGSEVTEALLREHGYVR